jgi:hypothetical protein
MSTASIGLTLLRLAPLVFSTVNLQFALDEHLFLSSFLYNPPSPPSSDATLPYRSLANSLLPSWFTYWLARGKWVIMLSFPASMAAALLNVYLQTAASGYADIRWYGLGAFFTGAHFLWAPWAVKMLNAIRADEPRGESTASLRTWITVNRWRAIFADLPAWVFFVMAVLSAVEVK